MHRMVDCTTGGTSELARNRPIVPRDVEIYFKVVNTPHWTIGVKYLHEVWCLGEVPTHSPTM